MDHDDRDHIGPDDPGFHLEAGPGSVENATIKNERADKTTNSENTKESVIYSIQVEISNERTAR